MALEVPRFDYCSEAGAQLLADILAAYWRQRGFEVSVRVEREGHIHPSAHKFQFFSVRSDLVGGRPQRGCDEKARVGSASVGGR